MNQETSRQNPETDIDQPIEALLPRYYEAYGDDPAYTIERLIVMEGHEVAWMRYDGTVKFDITGQGNEGKPYSGHSLCCACKFTEGVGWKIDEQRGTPVGLIGGDSCYKKEAAIHLRHLELREEYKQRGMMGEVDKYKSENIKAVLMDLIEKSKAGEFLEGSNGASFWGGYLYLQTLAEVMDLSVAAVRKATAELVEDNVIRMEGMVVQLYREPPEVPVYESLSEAPQAVLYQEKPNKVWALAPRPDETELKLDELTIDDNNHWSTIGRCIVGLADTPELAKARLEEAIANPRLSHERLYQRSFVETSESAGALAVIAYSARNSHQPEEWVVEGFVGDALTPEVHTLPMDYSTVWGIDVSDSQKLNEHIEKWWPK